MKGPFLQRFVEKYIWSSRASLGDPETKINDQTISEILSQGRQTGSGQTVNEEKALELSAVWRAVNLLSDTLAMLPVNVFRRVDDRRELQSAHIVQKLLHTEPNMIQTPFLFRKGLIVNAVLFGNGYAKIIRNGAFQPVSLQLLFGNQVAAFLHEGEKYYKVSGSQANNTKNEVLSDYEMIHIPGLTAGGLFGLNPIDYHRETLGGALASQLFASTFFGNGATLNYVLTHPGSLSGQAIANLRSSLARKAGAANAHDNLILEEGLKLEKIGSEPEKAQLLESRKFTVSEVARITGISPHLLFDLERSTFNNIEHLNIEFVNYTLQPWITKEEQEYNKKLFREDEKGSYYVKTNLNTLLRGDNKTRQEYYESMLRNGVFNRDEVRALEDMNPIPDGSGKFYTIEMNMQKLNSVGNGEEID